MTQKSVKSFSNYKESTPYIMYVSLFTWTEVSIGLVEDVHS